MARRPAAVRDRHPEVPLLAGCTVPEPSPLARELQERERVATCVSGLKAVCGMVELVVGPGPLTENPQARDQITEAAPTDAVVS